MAFPLALLLPALLPPVADGLRAIFNRVTGGAGVRPANTAEAIEFMKAEAAHARAMADLDTPAANISRWVADLRASFRYIAAGILVVAPFGLMGAQAVGVPVADGWITVAQEYSAQAFSFIFGDRMYRFLRK